MKAILALFIIGCASSPPSTNIGDIDLFADLQETTDMATYADSWSEPDLTMILDLSVVDYSQAPDLLITCGGNVCAFANASSLCIQGACVMGNCNTDFSDCNHDPKDGCESNVRTDPMNCGGCGMQCSMNNIAVLGCAAGQCVGNCKAGYADCNGDLRNDGCEASLLIESANCGACGNVCPMGKFPQFCHDGMCTLPLPGMACTSDLGCALPKNLPMGANNAGAICVFKQCCQNYYLPIGGGLTQYWLDCGQGFVCQFATDGKSSQHC